LLCIVCAGIFLSAGVGKFNLGGNMQENFQKWGYNDALLLIVGVLEVLGAVLLFIPKYRKYGIYVLITIMIGATITHFRFFEELGLPFFSIGLIIALIIVLILDKKQLNHGQSV
jgi:uncharacterized membrane protein YphA (DoxX/SURF4 family)